jgi:hypothetical protein
MNYRKIANFLCLPLTLGIYFLGVVFLWESWAYTDSDDVPSIVELPAVFLVFFILSWGGLVYLIGSQAVIVRAWLAKDVHWKRQALLVVYNIHLMPYFGFFIWWHRSGNHLN